jgi:hypothetical protein
VLSHRPVDPTGWLMHHPRLARACQTHSYQSEAVIHLVVIDLTARRLTSEATPELAPDLTLGQDQDVEHGAVLVDHLPQVLLLPVDLDDGLTRFRLPPGRERRCSPSTDDCLYMRHKVVLSRERRSHRRDGPAPCWSINSSTLRNGHGNRKYRLGDHLHRYP